MPLNGMILKEDGVVATTGGTDVTFQSDSQAVPNGIHLVDANDTDVRSQVNCTLRARKATYDQSTGKFTQKEKKSASAVIPVQLEDGSMSYNLIRIEREIHPEAFAQVANVLNSYGAQLLTDSDTASFWSAGSLA